MSTATPAPRIACPHCQASIKAPALPPGSAVNCPKCGQPFKLGGEPATPLPAAPPKAAVASQAPSAAAITQPAHRPRPPDHLVDPNMLAPPKPKPKPAAQEIAVICKLCGSRLHAPLSKAGQTIRCHDCHTENLVKAPVDPNAGKKAAARSTEPTLDDVEEFGLSEATERPAYRPLVATRGDDAILSELDPAAHPPGFSRPGPAGVEPPVESQNAAEQRNSTEGRNATEGVPYSADEVEEELTLSAPVERVEIKPVIVAPPVVIESDRNESLYDGRYDNDDLIGAGGIDRKAPDAWKKAPFLVGLVEFLFFPSTLARWSLYSIGAGAILSLVHLAVALTFSDEPAHQLGAIFVDGAGGLVTGMYIGLFSATLLAIIEDTANGRVEVESWPDWNIGDWLFRGLQVLGAAIVSGFLGMGLAIFLVAGGMPSLIAPLLLLASWTVLFPLVMYSMLVENSVMAVYSPLTFRSVQRAPEAWMLFYLYSVGLAIFAGGFATLAMWPNLIANLLGGAGLVTIAFVYCRVLGRLMWYCEEKLRKLPDEQT